MPFPGACIRPMVILSKTKHCQTHEPQYHREMRPCFIPTIFIVSKRNKWWTLLSCGKWKGDSGITAYCTADHKPHYLSLRRIFCQSLDTTSMKINIASKLYLVFVHTLYILILFCETPRLGPKSSSTSTTKRNSRLQMHVEMLPISN